jgi:hypothetical protein
VIGWNYWANAGAYRHRVQCGRFRCKPMSGSEPTWPAECPRRSEMQAPRGRSPSGSSSPPGRTGTSSRSCHRCGRAWASSSAARAVPG